MMARTLSDEQKAKMAAGRKAKADGSGAELAALRAEVEALKAQKPGYSEPVKPTMGSTLPPEVTGFREMLKQDMAEMLADQLQRALPERDIRQPAREVVRQGARVALDREGNTISRRLPSGPDQFAIPPDLKERDWDYQWVRVSTYGQEDVENQVAMQQNGWRPISANRPGWEGRFMPPGYQGHIHHRGLMLMERPMSLTQEAKEEDKKAVRDQTKRQREQFGLALPDGFTAATEKARANTGVRAGKFEAAPDEARPRHELEY